MSTLWERQRRREKRTGMRVPHFTMSYSQSVTEIGESRGASSRPTSETRIRRVGTNQPISIGTNPSAYSHVAMIHLPAAPPELHQTTLQRPTAAHISLQLLFRRVNHNQAASLLDSRLIHKRWVPAPFTRHPDNSINIHFLLHATLSHSDLES